MWTVKPAPIPVQSLTNSHPPPPPNHRRFFNLPTKSQTSESNETNQNKPVEKEISGSDVLWAIQRATAQRKKSNSDKKIKMSGVEEVLSSTVESTEDNGEVTPFRIKSDWGQRLEEFEKLLKEIQETEV